MSYQVDGELVTQEELFDQNVVDFVKQYYKEDLAEPLRFWLTILGENATPYANAKDMQMVKGEDGRMHEIANVYVLDLQYGIGAKKLYDALEKAKSKLDEKIAAASDRNMKKSFEFAKAALTGTVGPYVEKAKLVGKFYALKYKNALEFSKEQIEKELDDKKKELVKPFDDRIAATDDVISSLS